jgi:hypothetical protein
MIAAAQRFLAYRRMFATADDGVVNWWFSGMTYALLEGQPEIPIAQVCAIMTYRTETLAADAFRVHWSEIGVLFDPVTHELPRARRNPVTGDRIDMQPTFSEGPGSYVVHATADGVRVELDQPSARVQGVEVCFAESAQRFSFVQHERKQRGYARAEGTLPPMASSAFFDAHTELAFYALKSDLARPAQLELPVGASYRFSMAGIPPWMGFGALKGATRTVGAITRAPLGIRVNPRAWALLEEHLPQDLANPPALRRAG